MGQQQWGEPEVVPLKPGEGSLLDTLGNAPGAVYRDQWLQSEGGSRASHHQIRVICALEDTGRVSKAGLRSCMIFHYSISLDSLVFLEW